MKSYTITVNGTAYEVTVEETGQRSRSGSSTGCSSEGSSGSSSKGSSTGSRCRRSQSYRFRTGQSSQDRSICRTGSKSR